MGPEGPLLFDELQISVASVILSGAKDLASNKRPDSSLHSE
jgi:hypothetical protein